MAKTPVLNFQDFISADGELLFTTSNQVAAAFSKRHSDVLKAIRELCTQLPDDRQRNFTLTVEMRDNPSGGAMIPTPSYRITRDGFTWLGMRFRGGKALAFQVAYTDAFNAMAAFIKNQRDGLTFRCLKNDMETKDSISRGSFHGRGLNQRKREKPLLEAETAILQTLVQPTLLHYIDPT